MEALTQREQDQLASLLRRTTWPLAPAVFNAALGAIPTVAFEVVVFTWVMRKLHVLLLPRPDDDPFFAGLVHNPGTVMRKGDTVQVALRRAIGEFRNKRDISTPKFVGVEHVPMGPLPMGNPRGQEIGLVYYAISRALTLPKNALLADPEHLPQNIIGFHKPMIAAAVRQYKKEGNKRTK